MARIKVGVTAHARHKAIAVPAAVSSKKLTKAS